MCEVDNHFAVGDLVQVYDTNLNQWIWGNVKDKYELYITVGFVGLQSEYDEQIHVIKDKKRLRLQKMCDDIDDEKEKSMHMQHNDDQRESEIDINSSNNRKRKRQIIDNDKDNESEHEYEYEAPAKKRKFMMNEDEQHRLIQENENLKDQILALNAKLKDMHDNIDKIDLLDDKQLNDIGKGLRNKLKVIKQRKEKLMMNNGGNKKEMVMEIDQNQDEDDDLELDLVKNNKNLKEQVICLEATL